MSQNLPSLSMISSIYCSNWPQIMFWLAYIQSMSSSGLIWLSWFKSILFITLLNSELLTNPLLLTSNIVNIEESEWLLHLFVRKILRSEWEREQAFFPGVVADSKQYSRRVWSKSLEKESLVKFWPDLNFLKANSFSFGSIKPFSSLSNKNHS